MDARRRWRPGAAVTRRAMRVAALLLGVTVVAAGCGSSASPSSSPKAIPAPPGLPSFYAVPQPLPTTGPGTLLKSERLTVTGLDGVVYRVMYLSESVTDKPVPVTGLVIVPDKAAPSGGYPVVTWGHGTNGMADQCAPSLDPTSDVPLTNDLLDQGWEVTASDYQGEGTPGLLPYLVGVSAARNTIDIVRAARHLPAAHASDDYVVWGHSEGGQTAMFALHIGSSYAPDLHLEGVVAGAPPSQFYAIYQFLQTSPYRYYLFMAAGGFNAAYGNAVAPLDQVLTPAGDHAPSRPRQGVLGLHRQGHEPLHPRPVDQGGPDRHPGLEGTHERERPGHLHERQRGAVADHPGRKRRADPRRVHRPARHPPVRPGPGSRTVDLPRPEPRRGDRALRARHGPLDRRPLRRRPRPRSLHADRDCPGITTTTCPH